eukprot:9608-Heterococcus_DN1.PRE.1
MSYAKSTTLLVEAASASLHLFFFAQAFVFTRSTWGKKTASSGSWYNCFRGPKKDSTQHGSKWLPSTMRPGGSIYCASTNTPSIAGGNVKNSSSAHHWISSIEIMKDPIMHAAYTKHVE